MKINLTKLLEASGRVRTVGEKTGYDTASFTGIKSECTSADRAYSFELEWK